MLHHPGDKALSPQIRAVSLHVQIDLYNGMGNLDGKYRYLFSLYCLVVSLPKPSALCNFHSLWYSCNLRFLGCARFYGPVDASDQPPSEASRRQHTAYALNDKGPGLLRHAVTHPFLS